MSATSDGGRETTAVGLLFQIVFVWLEKLLGGHLRGCACCQRFECHRSGRVCQWRRVWWTGATVAHGRGAAGRRGAMASHRVEHRWGVGNMGRVEEFAWCSGRCWWSDHEVLVGLCGRRVWAGRCRRCGRHCCCSVPVHGCWLANLSISGCGGRCREHVRCQMRVGVRPCQRHSLPFILHAAVLKPDL